VENLDLAALFFTGRIPRKEESTRHFGGIIMTRFETTKLSKHESERQKLRHERMSESRRLDGLKKALQTKLQTDPSPRRAIHAA
jgi:hypothetical protein